MKTSIKKQLVYDNNFRWKYVGLMFIIGIYDIIMFFVIVNVVYYILIAALTYMSGENLLDDVSLFKFDKLYDPIWFTLMLLTLFVLTLPKMSTGKYRIDDDYLHVEEKMLGKVVTNIIIPLKSIKEVAIIRDRSRRSFLYQYFFKKIKITIKGESFNISCYEHRQELYDKLTEVINNQKI